MEIPVETYVGTANKAVTDEPTLAYWLTVEPTTLGTKGFISIRDGFSDSDEEKVRIVTGDGRPYNFSPPIRCAHGLFVDMESSITSYTIGYIRERNLPNLSP